MKYQILNDEGNVMQEKDMGGASFLCIYNGAYGVEHDKTGAKYIRFDDKHVMRQEYQERARELVNKYTQHLYNVSPHEIACIVDEDWAPSEKISKNSAWKIDIQRAPLWFRLLAGYEYILKMRGHWLEQWTDAQISAAIMSQLLRINQEDGSVLKYTEDFNSKLISTFGIGYLEPQTVIPDLLKEDVKIRGFKEASGQITMEEVIADAESEEEAS